MSGHGGPRPPRVARWLLHAALPADVRDDVTGDVEEVFARRWREGGPSRAQAWFWTQTLSLSTRFAMERFFREQNIDLAGSLVMNSNEAIKQAVQADLGLGFVSLHTIEQELALKRLAVLKVAGLPVLRHWYIVHRKDRTLSHVAIAFREFVLSHAHDFDLPGID